MQNMKSSHWFWFFIQKKNVYFYIFRIGMCFLHLISLAQFLNFYKNIRISFGICLVSNFSVISKNLKYFNVKIKKSKKSFIERSCSKIYHSIKKFDFLFWFPIQWSINTGIVEQMLLLSYFVEEVKMWVGATLWTNDSSSTILSIYLRKNNFKVF